MIWETKLSNLNLANAIKLYNTVTDVCSKALV